MHIKQEDFYCRKQDNSYLISKMKQTFFSFFFFFFLWTTYTTLTNERKTSNFACETEIIFFALWLLYCTKEGLGQINDNLKYH